MKIRFILFALVISLVACEKYEDYVLDTVGFTNVYFPTQEFLQGRSPISGEGLEIKVGAYLGGIRTNNQERTVTFSIEESLLDGTTYTLLPTDYYTLDTPGEIIIPKGEFLGMVTVKFDSMKLASDENLRGLNYALPLVIEDTDASIDSIHANKNYTIVPIKLMNTYEGYYYHIGHMKEFFTVKNVLDTAFVFGDTLNLNSDVRQLKTEMMDSVLVDGIATYSGEGYRMKLKVNADNTVEVIPLDESLFQVEPNGVSTWDPKRRRFELKYKFTSGDKYYEVEELFIFRNRIRDGLNEWRWEGFEGN